MPYEPRFSKCECWYTSYTGMMKTLWVILILALAGAAAGADKKSKPPDIEVLEASAHRGETTISVDGRIRNSGEKPIKELTLLFNFMAPGRQVVTTQKGRIEEEILEPGQEAAFHMELNGPPRSVRFEIGAADGAGRDLRVGKPGPFVIE
jgi:hypothetical protein